VPVVMFSHSAKQSGEGGPSKTDKMNKLFLT
jgi:hypothetical protein